MHDYQQTMTSRQRAMGNVGMVSTPVVVVLMSCGLSTDYNGQKMQTLMVFIIRVHNTANIGVSLYGHFSSNNYEF